MMAPDRHVDQSEPSFRLPGGKLTPWLENRPMYGIYQTQVGQIHHWLATASDARRPQFAQIGGRDFGFVLYDVTNCVLTHKEYASLYKLESGDSGIGPPGTVKDRNF